MNIPSQNNSYIELHVPDFKQAKDYYTQMGFEIVWVREPEEFKGYLVIKLEDNILAFWGGNEKIFEHPYFKNFNKDTKRGYGVEIVVMIKDIESYYNKVKDFANVVEPLITQPWGLKDFRVEDPFGYYLRFTAPDNILDPSNAVK
jgi:uncharacterized glyoxalase superfamily protein PhnB